MKTAVHGIPTCQTCKNARSWLDGEGRDHDWIDLRDSPPSAARVKRWVKALGAKALRNTSGKSYRSLGPERDGWSDAEWTDAFVRDPMLIKRPVLELDGKPVAVGFKAGVWEELL